MKRSLFAQRVLMIVVAVLVVGTLAAVAQACPTCKDAIAGEDPHHQNMVQGYFYSILFMMSMPFLLIGGFSSYMYLEVRRARREQASRNPSEHDEPPHDAPRS